VLALFLFNFDRKAFTAETYQRAFASDDFYNKVPSMMADTMTSPGTDQSKIPDIMQGMSKEGWEAFFRTLLPPETLKVMGDDVLNSTFAYLNMQSDSAQLNLAPLKGGLASDTGVQAVLSLLGTLPECNFLQIAQMSLNLFSGGKIELCNPPADLYPLLSPVIQGQLQVTAAVIPDQVTIMSAPPQDDPRQQLSTARLIMRSSPFVPLIFLLGLTILAVRSYKTLLSWWGIPILITGAVAFVMSLIGAPVFGAVLERFLVDRMPAYLPVILLDHASDLASVMVQTLLSPVMWQGLILAFIGMVLALASLLVGYMTTPKTAS
jgi:hypothetical protein